MDFCGITWIFVIDLDFCYCLDFCYWKSGHHIEPLGPCTHRMDNRPGFCPKAKVRHRNSIIPMQWYHTADFLLIGD